LQLDTIKGKCQCATATNIALRGIFKVHAIPCI